MTAWSASTTVEISRFNKTLAGHSPRERSTTVEISRFNKTG